MDWDLSLNSGKQSVWWSLSQSVCYFRHLPIYCHSSDWQFLNLDFFAWYEVFFFFFLHNWYQHSPNMYSFLPCRQHSEICKHQAGDKSSGKPFRRGCLWDPQVQFKMDCTVLANVGLPFEGTKDSSCTTWEPYSVFLWESLYEGFRFENHTRISGEVGSARSDLAFGKCGELLLSHKQTVNFQASDLLSLSI